MDVHRLTDYGKAHKYKETYTKQKLTLSQSKGLGKKNNNNPTSFVGNSTLLQMPEAWSVVSCIIVQSA